MPKFILSPSARRDLDEIWDYTLQRWNQEQAETYLRDIQRLCENLAVGTAFSVNASDIRRGYRKAKVGSHFLFYKTLEDGTIDIIRISHGRMDLRSRLS